MSPQFYGIYVNDLILIFCRAGIGCHMIRLFIACILYADDIALIAPLRSIMQTMIDMCLKYDKEHCLSFNFKKNKTMIFGKQKSLPIPLKMGDSEIDYVKEWKYLGANVVSRDASEDWLSFSVERSKFYCAFNSIIHSSMNLSNEVLMKLLYSNCVTALSYAAEVKEHSASDMRSMNTAINDAIRRIFSYQRWESVRALRESTAA